MHHSAIDLTGQRFGRLVVVERAGWEVGRHIVWKCECDCGNKCLVSSGHLKSGHTQSCGCLRKEMTSKRTIKHGMCGSSIYEIWNNMIQRCENPNHPGYKNYGGRGISVCERWHKIEKFYEDVGDPPPGKSLDRYPNNDGNYEFSNFRWASRQEQRSNCRPISCGPARQRWFMAFNTNTGEWFEDNNQRAFAREHGLKDTSISRCLCGRRKTHKGWTFDFLT